MSQTTQVRVAVGLNLLAACAGVVFFAFDAWRLATGRVMAGHRVLAIAWLFLYAGGAWVFWGRYRRFAELGRGGAK